MKIKKKISLGIMAVSLLAMSACTKPIKQDYVNRFKKIGLISFMPNRVSSLEMEFRNAQTDIINSSYPLAGFSPREDYAQALSQSIKENTDLPLIPYDPKAVEKARLEALYIPNLLYQVGKTDLEEYRKQTGCDAVFILTYMPREKYGDGGIYNINGYGYIFRVLKSSIAYLKDTLYLYDLNEKKVVWEHESFYWESISAAAGDGGYSTFADLEKENLAPLKKSLAAMFKDSVKQHTDAMGKGIKTASDSKNTPGTTTIFDNL